MQGGLGQGGGLAATVTQALPAEKKAPLKAPFWEALWLPSSFSVQKFFWIEKGGENNVLVLYVAVFRGFGS
jgi:hypothetical protein